MRSGVSSGATGETSRWWGLEHAKFLLRRGVADDDLEQESIELGLGQRVDALLFEGVLRGEHEEGRGEHVGGALDGDLSLLHRLKQGGLRLGGGAVDLVAEHDVREDRPLAQHELVRLQIGDVNAGDIGGEQIGGELDTSKGDLQGAREGAHEGGLGDAGHAL